VENPPADHFPDELSGHFWATLSRVDDLDRWRFVVSDYQNNVLLTGLASTEQQAARIVRAWDAVIVSEFSGNDDPSLPFSERGE
jgi:hypothetical protein